MAAATPFISFWIITLKSNLKIENSHIVNDYTSSVKKEKKKQEIFLGFKENS